MGEFRTKLGTGSGTYRDKGREIDYKRMKRHGFDYVDFGGLVGGKDDFLSLPDGEFEKELLAERRRAEEAGIVISQVHGVWPTDDTTEEKRREFMEKHKKAVRGTAVLGVKYLVVHPLMPYGWEKEEDADLAEKMNEEFFIELCGYAEGYNVDICIENMPMKKHRLSRVPKMAEFVRRLNLPNLHMCFDTGHVNVFKDDCGEMVRLCGDIIKVLHVHDNYTHADEHLYPFTGTVDWRGFVAALDEIGFDGVFSSETTVSRGYPTKELREEMEVLHARLIKTVAEL